MYPIFIKEDKECGIKFILSLYETSTISLYQGWGKRQNILFYLFIAMKLLTKEILKTLPKLYAQDSKGENAIVYVKFFTPDAQWTWYVLEGEKRDDDFEFFGIVEGMFTEYGYFMLSELKEVRGAFGLPIERDLYFEPTKVKDLYPKIDWQRGI